MTVIIDVESPLTDEVRTLIAELNTVLLALSPPEAIGTAAAAEQLGAQAKSLRVEPR